MNTEKKSKKLTAFLFTPIVEMSAPVRSVVWTVTAWIAGAAAFAAGTFAACNELGRPFGIL